MPYDNKILDAAFEGKRNLTDDQRDAFEAGQVLACWFATGHVVMLLKTHGLEDLAAAELDKNVVPFDEACKMARDTNPSVTEMIKLDPKIARDGYTRAFQVVKALLKA